MTEALAAELVDAYLDWDLACTRLSERCARERYTPSAGDLRAQTNRLVDATHAAGLPYDWTTAVAALRWHRDGSHNLSARDAATTVVQAHINAAGTPTMREAS